MEVFVARDPIRAFLLLDIMGVYLLPWLADFRILWIKACHLSSPACAQELELKIFVYPFFLGLSAVKFKYLGYFTTDY